MCCWWPTGSRWSGEPRRRCERSWSEPPRAAAGFDPRRGGPVAGRPADHRGAARVDRGAGSRWARKREFHLTALAARLLDPPEERPDVWDQIGQVAAGRQLGPVRAGREFRRVSHPDRADLETLIVMAECPGLDELVRDLSQAIAGRLPVPPAHVTLYSTDAAQGIGITDERELAERAPPLSESEQEDIRRAVGW